METVATEAGIGGGGCSWVAGRRGVGHCTVTGRAAAGAE